MNRLKLYIRWSSALHKKTTTINYEVTSNCVEDDEVNIERESATNSEQEKYDGSDW